MRKIGHEQSFENLAFDLLEFLQRPSVFISLILLSVTLIMFMQFSNQQRQLLILQNEIKGFELREIGL